MKRQATIPIYEEDRLNDLENEALEELGYQE